MAKNRYQLSIAAISLIVTNIKQQHANNTNELDLIRNGLVMTRNATHLQHPSQPIPAK